jgi:chromate reductase, NAD(P)H dehydrogenase (quinone)
MKQFLLLACLALAAPLAADKKVLAISGSTRDGSYNSKLAQEASAIARKMGATVTLINLKDYPLPFYDADLEMQSGLPSNAKRLRELMINSDAILIASPEYNASLPAVLKNAIDWTTRDEKGQPSRDAFKGKKFALLSTSPGPGGGSRGLSHLRDIIQAVGGEVVQTQAIVPNAMTAFDEKGELKSTELKQKLQREIELLIK